MKLKQYRRYSWLINVVNAKWRKNPWRVLAVLFYTCFIFVFGYFVHRSGFTFHRTLSILNSEFVSIPMEITALLSKPKKEHIFIDIKYDDFVKLAHQREVALVQGFLVQGQDDFVPATINHNDDAIKVELRLKGDWLDHLQGNKWSFRIKVKGDQTLFGMQEFSIQHPGTRNYLYEWIYHQALKKEGVLSLRYEFIYVSLNGEELGIYALEEHFDKRLVEFNHLREGPIIRFDENLLWLERFQQWRNFPHAVLNGTGSLESSPIDSFQTNQMLSDPERYAQSIKATSLLEAYRRGELNRSDVFDVPKYARFFAISDLLGAQHGLDWQNIRFYYNPVTSRLEPIGFDGHGGYPIESLGGLTDHYNDLERVYMDLVFIEEYVKTLERVSEPSYLDALFTELNDELMQNYYVMYREFPDFKFSKDILYRNQDYIRTVLKPIKGLHGYYHQAFEDQIELDLGNIQSIPVEVLNVTFGDKVVFKPAESTIMIGKQPSELVNYQKVRFNLPEGYTWSDSMINELTVSYKLLGTTRIRREQVFALPYLSEEFGDNDLIRQEPNFKTFDFLVVDDTRREILIAPGTWSIDRNLIIPKGYRVICSEGVHLNLANSAMILSYSPFLFVGSQDDPIMIESQDGSGQGIVVLNAGEASIFNYAIFHNLSAPSKAGWELTGAVTFYESRVQISNSRFIGNNAEDSLNIVRSEFTIDNTVFSKALFDALDVDFAKGEITKSSFFSIGNDAIDVSGSVINVEKISIDGSGDKAISVGENSQVTVNRIEIKNARIAIASKDLSELRGQEIKISDGEYALTAFQKKPEFGPGSIQLEGVTIENVNIPYLVEENSTVIVDRKAIPESRSDIYETLYGANYGKDSD